MEQGCAKGGCSSVTGESFWSYKNYLTNKFTTCATQISVTTSLVWPSHLPQAEARWTVKVTDLCLCVVWISKTLV